MQEWEFELAISPVADPADHGLEFAIRAVFDAGFSRDYGVVHKGKTVTFLGPGHLSGTDPQLWFGQVAKILASVLPGPFQASLLAQASLNSSGEEVEVRCTARRRRVDQVLGLEPRMKCTETVLSSGET